MTKGEWMDANQIYISGQRREDEATPDWIRAAESVLNHFDEIFEDEEE